MKSSGTTIDFSTYKYLSQEEIQFFTKNGYVILKSIIPKDVCHQYDQNIIQPTLQKLANLNESNPSTWFLEKNSKLSEFMTHSPLYRKCAKGTEGDGEEGFNDDDDDDDDVGIPIGLMVRDSKNIHDDLNPISTEDGGNWKELLKNERLNGILDELHCSPTEIITEDCNTNLTQPSRKRRWEYLHPKNVGWIHVRLPISYDDHFQKKDKIHNFIGPANDRTNNDLNEEKQGDFHIPINENTWHVDGGHFSPHYLSSLDQSVILLPMIRNIQHHEGYGNTVLLRGSHVKIARKLHSKRKEGIDETKLREYCEDLSKIWPKEAIMEVSPCDAGDVLLLHPFLVHSAGWNTRQIIEVDQMHNDSVITEDCFRLTFNIGTRWKQSSFEKGYDNDKQEKLIFDPEKIDQMSILEWTIFNSIEQ